jgi:hypothetical protein
MAQRGRKPGSGFGTFRGEARRDARRIANQAPAADKVDVEIRDARAADRAIELDKAFPDPPASATRTRFSPHINPATGEIIGEERLKTVHLDASGFIIEGPSEWAPDDQPEPMEISGFPDKPGKANPPTIFDEGARKLAELEQSDPSYHKEYQLKLLHRMMLRNMDMADIARKLRLKVPQVIVLREELKKRMAWEAGRIDTMEYFGKTMSFYDEVRGMALEQADDPRIRTHNKLAALTTALAAESDRQRFLHLLGVTQKMPWTPSALIEGDRHHRQAEEVLGLLTEILREPQQEEDDDPEPGEVV